MESVGPEGQCFENHIWLIVLVLFYMAGTELSFPIYVAVLSKSKASRRVAMDQTCVVFVSSRSRKVAMDAAASMSQQEVAWEKEAGPRYRGNKEN